VGGVIQMKIRVVSSTARKKRNIVLLQVLITCVLAYEEGQLDNSLGDVTWILI
jgi:hypothetical protein